MTVRRYREGSIRWLVEHESRGGHAPPLFVVAAQPAWSGPDVVDSDAGPVRVAACASPLAVRAAVACDDASTLVVLTDAEPAQLGSEVLALAHRRQVLRLHDFDHLRNAFKVDSLDPALADARWLVDALVDVAPPRGYPPPASGLLDRRTAWRTLARHGLDLDLDQLDLAALLRWGTDDASRARLQRFRPDVRTRIVDRLADEVGAGARPVLGLVAAGRVGDVVAFGLAVACLTGGSDASTVVARTLLDERHGPGKVDDDDARAWGRAAERVVRDAEASEATAAVVDWVTRAEWLLADVDLLDASVASAVLPAGFDGRLERLAAALMASLVERRPEVVGTAEAALEPVEQHLRAERERDRVTRARNAVRLVRWLVSDASGSDPVPDLAAAARRYERDGAWADEARFSLAEGEVVADAADAYGALVTAADGRRLARDREFAARLAAWTEVPPPHESAEILPIEQVLDEVVTPLARQHPLLFIVLDGLSHAESHRLVEDCRRDGWQLVEPEARPWRPVVAALPTVTSVSRTSLLTGALRHGGQPEEREGFMTHPALTATGAARLFHKADLDVEGGHPAPQVRNAILDPDVRTVGVVVNAVDDHLAKGGQLQLAAGLEGIPPLRWLLRAAVESGRAVLVTSDHGHVRERHSTVRPAAGGERWRHAQPPPGDGEVLLAGPRVLAGDGRIVAPADETVRYHPEKKRGYHGGATPQEVLCPVFALAPARLRLDGYGRVGAREPAWWSGRRELPQSASVTPAPATVDVDGTPTLFDPATPQVAPRAVARGGWIDDLLRSPGLAAQRQVAGRQTLDDTDLVQLVRLLESASWVTSVEALQDALGLPALRTASKVRALAQLLNVEGYAVVDLEADGTVRVNPDLLGEQFDVDPHRG